MAEHNIFGSLVEKKIVAYLERNEYEILHTNWRYGHKELDAVAIDKDVLVIIEVKARKTKIFGDPYQAVTDIKIKRTISAANAYIKKYNINRDIRFDIVSVVQNQDDSFEIEHIKDAFFPPIN